jgi:cytidylate kinase
MELKFKNISISGGVGVGTTTLMNNLKPYLEPEGWKFKSTGQFIREYTKEKVLPLATLVTDDFDREIEARAKETLEKEKNWVIDAWLAGFISREIPHVLRVLLICSSEPIRIDRIVNRDKISVEEAKTNLKKREEENFKKWKRIYGDYDFFNPEYYHLIIDTYSSGQMETVGKVLDKLGYKK